MTEEQKAHRENIKSWYIKVLPDLKKDIRIDPYFIDWCKYFSPIESLAWGVIRSLGIPLYPEYPACGYFIDFADPIKKIGLELDGAQFHNVKKDMSRDTVLWKDGWSIIRVTGREMNAIELDDVMEEIQHMAADGYSSEEVQEKKIELANQWINTGDGIIHAIAAGYYGKTTGLISCLQKYKLDDVLRDHSYLPIRALASW